MWAGVHAGINAQRAADAAALKASQPPLSARLTTWWKTFFFEYKVAWMTAAATAAAVALVMSFMDNDSVPNATNSPIANVTNDSGVKVIEKHYIYVDSVDQADPNSTVVVNSMQEDNTAVIWLLPDGEKPDDDDENVDNSVQIEEEPL
jgi:hypothetical protein